MEPDDYIDDGWDDGDDTALEGIDAEPHDYRLGACCACGVEDTTVRNLLCLHQLAPVPGTGWGCLQCGQPQDGALAVVCDACLMADTPLQYAILGPVGEGRRIRIGELKGTFDHDPRGRPELQKAGKGVGDGR